jgi:general stress protein 26
MFVTHDGVENFHARPMAIAGIEKSCVIWFITNAGSGKVHEIENDTHVAVICQKDYAAYLSISGTASLVDDRAQIERLWNDSLTVWFPGGKDDPSIALIRVAPFAADYWDNEMENS